MKEIRAIIQPHMLDKVVKGLHGLEHFPGFTVREATGQGRGLSAGGPYRPKGDDIFLHRKVVVEIICSDESADSVVEAILRDAHTGRSGDGLITVRTLDKVIRIRSGESGDKAV